MPLVKMLKTAAGPFGTFISGSSAHVDDETAAAWIADGAAEAVDAPAAEPAIEVAPAPESKPSRGKKKDEAPAEPSGEAEPETAVDEGLSQE